MNNRLLLTLTVLRSKLRNGTATETDIANAFSEADCLISTTQQQAGLAELREQFAGGDHVHRLDRFISEQWLHESVGIDVADAETIANASRQDLANSAAEQVLVIANTLYPDAVYMVLNGSHGNFTLGGCLNAARELIEDSLNDGEMTGLNRLLRLIRTTPTSVPLISEQLTGNMRLVLSSPTVDVVVADSAPVDPIHAALGFVPEPGEFNMTIVNQDKYWVGAAGEVSEISTMSINHVNSVIGYLVNRRQQIAVSILWNRTNAGAEFADMSDVAHDVFQDFLDQTPSEMLESTPLMKELRALIEADHA